LTALSWPLCGLGREALFAYLRTKQKSNNTLSVELAATINGYKA